MKKRIKNVDQNRKQNKMLKEKIEKKNQAKDYK
jgi:hypothetical protein